MPPLRESGAPVPSAEAGGFGNGLIGKGLPLLARGGTSSTKPIVVSVASLDRDGLPRLTLLLRRLLLSTLISLLDRSPSSPGDVGCGTVA